MSSASRSESDQRADAVDELPQGEEREESHASDDDSLGPPDYYGALGVGVEASPDELRRAYIRLVKLWHPDRYVSAPEPLRARAERRVRQINEAYDTLSDPEARARYDRQRVGFEVPFGDVINVFGQRSAAPITRDTRDEAGHASANPNGAGQFFGLLAAILALGLIGGALSGSGGIGSGVGAVVVLVGIVALLAAALFFMNESPLAKWANGAMEAEPKRYAEARRAAERRRPRPSEPPPASAAAGAADAPASREAMFDALIAEALASVPHEFDEYMRNVVVRAEEEPDEETLRAAGVPPGHTLLGLYHGVSLTRRGAGEVGPEVITIYRGPIERYCGGDLARMRLQVRATVRHELAHHFGLDHDEMPESVK